MNLLSAPMICPFNKHFSSLLKHGLSVLLIILTTSVVFLSVNRDKVTHHEPLGYDGDSLAVLAHIKASEDGGMMPLFSPVRIKRLNAPYEGLWSDVPISKLVYWLPSILAGSCGVFSASTWFVASALCVAGIAFYFSALALGAHPIPSAVLGVLFALLPFGFVRNLEHLSLTLYFVVPLYIACAARLWGSAGEKRSSKEILLMGLVVFICALFNPYYWAMFLVLIGFVGIGHLANRNCVGISASVALGVAACMGFLIQNADTFYFHWIKGANPIAISRDLWWMVKFGLYLPDLLLPTTHRLECFQHLAGKEYHWKIPVQIQGESQTAYVGIIAAVSLVMLVTRGFVSASANRTKSQSHLFWFALVVFCFAVVGGANYLLGAMGFQMLRGTNRYSIFLAALGLFYLSILLTRISQKQTVLLGISALLLPLGLWDQIPKIPEWIQAERDQAMERFRMDCDFFPLMEGLFPHGASVFELPVHPYPEHGPVNAMGDYEHFRPYLHTKEMRFSYGTVKGREPWSWQMALDPEKTPEFMNVLKGKGFSAILINRRAYQDGGIRLKGDLEKCGARSMIENKDFFVLSLI